MINTFRDEAQRKQVTCPSLYNRLAKVKTTSIIGLQVSVRVIPFAHQMHVTIESFLVSGAQGGGGRAESSITSGSHSLIKSPKLCAVGGSLFKLRN